ncbi:MAG: ABC transporter ATP-binding protein [Rhodospirillum sp.]|nr:ABC transporter ATP-binding protein [Rhodospirillum sp.]MCF8490074.1 ABC transporter ATP-binding protein [Rhodospirillum sp.]MCF8500433.1 ABC transporter ATP-binding protein [Rhodospirillum sp.]
MTALLDVTGLTAQYGDSQALFGIDFSLDQGETVSIIGSNGAGKSTFLKSLCGLLPRPVEAIRFKGAPIGGLAAHQVAKAGIALVPEGRRLFPSLSVEDNLRIGATTGRPGPWSLPRVYDLFPALHARRKQPGTALSGGQQQMVAIGRALMANPEVLLCDEISLGLAPTVIKDIYRGLETVIGEGTSVIVVEQDIAQALKVSSRFYCFQEGRVSLKGRPGAVPMADISAAYFGV